MTALDDLAHTLRAHAVTPGQRNTITTAHRRLIRQARAAGMRIHEIAALLGVAVTTVSKYSSDRQQERLDEYQRARHVRRRAAGECWWARKEAA